MRACRQLSRLTSLACLAATGHLCTAQTREATGAPADNPDIIIQAVTAGVTEHTLHLESNADGGSRSRTKLGILKYAPLEFPLSAQPLIFQIQSGRQGQPEPVRIQYRLDGWDEGWVDPESFMFLQLRFSNEDGRRIESLRVPRAGSSKGWTGDPKTSRFTVTSEKFVVPAGARHMQLTFYSGGSPRTTGVWLVKHVRIAVGDTTGRSQSILLDEAFNSGTGLGEPEDTPAGWMREGPNPRTPQVFTLDPATHEYALALLDTNDRTTDSWAATGDHVVEVNPGTTLLMQIEEAFSIGRGGSYECSYRRLTAGHYKFKVIPVDAFGNQSGVGVELPIELVPPFYQRWWFWIGIAVAGLIAVIYAVRFIAGKRLRQQLEQAERRHAVEQERIRIAQDIHDDMGARMTQISLINAAALRSLPKESPAFQQLQRMDQAAREVVIAMDEIVWAVNPAHDTLEGFGNYLSQYVTEIAAGDSTLCRLDIPTLLPARSVSSGVRHQLLMAVKEALNNALKHSSASEIIVRLNFVDPILTVIVEDNGGGFAENAQHGGEGMLNMQRRLQSVGGTSKIESAPGKGTTVSFLVSLQREPD